MSVGDAAELQWIMHQLSVDHYELNRLERLYHQIPKWRFLERRRNLKQAKAIRDQDKQLWAKLNGLG